jgi:hypothetical protein
LSRGKILLIFVSRSRADEKYHTFRRLGIGLTKHVHAPSLSSLSHPHTQSSIYTSSSPTLSHCASTARHCHNRDDRAPPLRRTPRHQPMLRQAPTSPDAALSPCTTGCHHNNADRVPPPRVASSPHATTVHHVTLLMSDPFSVCVCVCVCVQEGRAVADRGRAARISPMRRWWDPERRRLDSEQRRLLQASSLPPPMASVMWIHARVRW